MRESRCQLSAVLGRRARQACTSLIRENNNSVSVERQSVRRRIAGAVCINRRSLVALRFLAQQRRKYGESGPLTSLTHAYTLGSAAGSRRRRDSRSLHSIPSLSTLRPTVATLYEKYARLRRYAPAPLDTFSYSIYLYKTLVH